MADPYLPPDSPPSSGWEVEAVRQKRKFWLRAIWISVAGMVIPPVFGLIGTVVGMIGAFGVVSGNGEMDASALSHGVSTSLISTALGIVVSVIAFVFFVCSMTRFVMLPKISGVVPGK